MEGKIPVFFLEPDLLMISWLSHNPMPFNVAFLIGNGLDVIPGGGA
jgi:hypothetical protein